MYIGLEVYYEAFLALTTCRSQGYGTQGPISWLMIAEYADRMEFYDEQREDLFHFVAVLDKAYLDFQVKQLQSRTQLGKAKGKVPSKVIRPATQVKRKP